MRQTPQQQPNSVGSLAAPPLPLPLLLLLLLLLSDDAKSVITPTARAMSDLNERGIFVGLDPRVGCMRLLPRARPEREVLLTPRSPLSPPALVSLVYPLAGAGVACALAIDACVWCMGV